MNNTALPCLCVNSFHYKSEKPPSRKCKSLQSDMTRKHPEFICKILAPRMTVSLILSLRIDYSIMYNGNGKSHLLQVS